MTAPDNQDAVAPPPETLDELYEHAPCGYLTTQADGVIVRVNTTLLDLLAATRPSLLGHPFQTILTAGAGVAYETRCVPVLNHHGVLNGIALDLACSDNRRLPALLSWRRIGNTDGTAFGYRIAVIGATDRAAYEHELLAERARAQQLEARLGVLTAELEDRVAARTAERVQAQKMDSLGQLTGGIAHDFNNLLTPILITLDLLNSRYISDERALRMAASALSAAHRARVLVARLLAFARRQHLKAQAVDLRRLAETMLPSVTSLVEPQITVQVDIAANLPSARVDPAQLEIAVQNLCANARDAMPEGGCLTIAADTATISDKATGILPAGQYVRLSVSDTGAGMTPDTLRRAPEPFYTTKDIGKGTGLGLSMVHGLAAQSGGTLVLESEPGHGTKATIWLPADKTANDQAADRLANPGTGQQRPRRVLSILLVDDDELVRFAAGEMLAELGHTIVQASSGMAALQVLRQHTTFDLLITDYLMPNMTGVELARSARITQPGLPVLLVTGYANINDVDGGGLPRLAKPFSTGDLSSMITETLAIAAMEGAASRRLA